MKENGTGKPRSGDAQDILDSIRRLVRGLRHSSIEAERRHGLSSAQLFVLSTLADSGTPLSVNDLAARTLTHQSSVSVVASKLFARGLIRKRRATADSRRVELVLTERGKRALGKDPEPLQGRLIEAIEGLDPVLRHRLARGFREILAASGLDREKAALFFEDSPANRA